MPSTNDNAPEVVVETLDKAEQRWQTATIAVLALTAFLCVCISGVLLANFMQSGSSQASLLPTPTRRATFAATWTPTPTDTASPTAPAPPTPTSTDTSTDTPTPTDTPQFTSTFTPRPPTNTPRPRPTNTRRPPPTHTPVPPPSFALRVSNFKTFANCCSVGVFGTVRNGSGLISGVFIRLIPAGASTAYQTTTTASAFGNGGDRNYELSTHNGIGPGNYTLVAVDAFGNAVSLGAAVNLCSAGSPQCPQWVNVDLMQN